MKIIPDRIILMAFKYRGISMKKAGWITFFYGLIMIIGGVIGYMQAASTTSLVMGIICGGLLILSAFGMMKDKLFSMYGGVILILILDGFFTFRWLHSFQFFPAGLFSLISLGVLISVLILIRNHLHSQRDGRH